MASGADYIECHARSAFSFLYGASQPETMAERASELDLAGMALCDRNGFYGSVRFHQRATEHGIRAMIGAELVMMDGTAVPVIVLNRRGYRNLSRLITRAQLRAPKGEAALAWKELAEVSEDLAVLSGDEEGPLEVAWRARGAEGMREALETLRGVVPAENLWIELQRHCLRGEDQLNRAKVDLAEATGIPLLATNGTNFAVPENRTVQDVFTCLRHHVALDNAGRLLAPNNDRHLKPGAFMAARFRDLPEAVLNTRRLAERVEFTLENLGYEFPRYPVPEGETMDSFLEKMAMAGARDRYGKITRLVREQLQKELALIRKLGFSGYFLIVWDMIRYCRDNGIMVQGRGSAANSAVCYSLGITPVDPIGAKLLFERFLTEARQAWPDIDLDLPSGDQRESVIQEVYQRYSRRGAAMTANVITYRGRSAMREIGKVLGFPEEMLGRFTDLYASGDYPHTLEFREQVKQSGIDIESPQTKALMHVYPQVYGLPRHLGQHSGGMIICQGELDAIVPLENASMTERTVAQWDKDDCEDMGIVKVDFLGLGMMAVMQESIELSRERGRPLDLARIPKDDEATYDLMCAADTVGVFQVESRAQMSTLRRMKPRTFYDVVIEVAIVRPGPIVGDLAHPFLNRRDGLEEVDYIDEKLKPTLERTLGVPMFQEQVLKMAMVMADFSGSEAEELRRAMSFHRSHERMQRVEKKLLDALRERDVDEAKIEKIVKTIGSFALYGFPESHAISFGILAYASCYLKVHHAVEFYTALLNNQPMGFYAPATLIQDAKRRGLKFLPPCVVESEWVCTIIDDRTIRLGLLMVKGVAKSRVEEMLAVRARRAFSSLVDLRARTRFECDELRSLAHAGALNAFAGSRRKALWQVERLQPEQGDLFASGFTEVMAADVSPLREMTYPERMHADFEGTGVTVGMHPMKLVRPQLPESILTAEGVKTVPSGRRVEVAGAVICRQRPGTAKGVVFISLEDETGISNSIVYPDLFEKLRLTIKTEAFLHIVGTAQQAEGSTHILVKDVRPLKLELPAAASHDFH
ncbi:MAG: error-prone DNA polymerase [Verrucomicrobiota bacterium]